MWSILNQINVYVSSSVKIPPKQKLKTWKFAGKFLWKNTFVKDKAELGRWTKEELLELGPTFVKLGQIASTRGDLYPPEFTKELESLQDDVPPVEFDTIVNYDIFKNLTLYHLNPRVSAKSIWLYSITVKKLL